MPSTTKTMAQLTTITLLALLFSPSATAQDMLDDVEGQNRAGAEGPSSDSVGVSSTGMIILATIVGVVVVIGISSAALFIVAKRRQWAMRETIRRSARHVTQAIKTPLTPRFPRSQLSRGDQGQGGSPDRSQEEERNRKQKNKDLEKNVVVSEREREASGDRGTGLGRGWGSKFSFGRGRSSA